MQSYPLVIDRRDDCLRRAYALLTWCRNCGEKHASLFNKGQVPHAADKDERCPYCECAGFLHYGCMKDGYALAQSEYMLVKYDDPRDGFVLVPGCVDVWITVPLPAALLPPAPAQGNAKVYDA